VYVNEVAWESNSPIYTTPAQPQKHPSYSQSRIALLSSLSFVPLARVFASGSHGSHNAGQHPCSKHVGHGEHFTISVPFEESFDFSTVFLMVESTEAYPDLVSP
jgi:hypothetical protein